ncbi:MAG: stage II sporulation protein M, partial [Armatimonadetes bacterium]|nr:stage II sporulation protein M [Anaerolineae bacterium]
IDQLNLRGMFRRMWRSFRGVDTDLTPARNLIAWYQHGVFPAVRAARVAITITAVTFTLFFIAGIGLGLRPEWRLPLETADTSSSVAVQTLNSYLRPEVQNTAVALIIVQNGRILLAALLLSIFSFGVASLVLTPAVYVILGYIISQVALSGNSLALVAAAIVPHGIVEIPVIVLAAAAALRLGAVVTRPPTGLTVGQAWMQTLGETLKIGVGLVLPGLIIAALLEAYLTPLVVRAALGG